jgi:putative ABC transport system permease protein
MHALGLGRPRPEYSAAWEIEHHIAEATDRLVASGMDAEAARREAERRFGDRTKYERPMTRMERRRMAIERRSRAWDLLKQSAVSAWRTAGRSPTFAAGVVLTLGLGIGANATMYGVVDRLLLQPPDHVQDPDRVVRIFQQRPSPFSGELVTGGPTYPDYADQRAHAGLAAVAAYTSVQERTVGAGEEASRAQVALASAELFPLLGVVPTLGRFYTEEEGAEGAPLTAVLGAQYWRSAYGANPGVIGRRLMVAGHLFTIIGVAPHGFTGVDLQRVDIWLPLEATHVAWNRDGGCLDTRNCWWMYAVARLSEDVSVGAAEAEATRLHLNGRRAMIDEGRYSDQARIVLGPLIAARGPNASEETPVVRWLVGVSAIVLLIACANVANLLMARGTERRREIGVRLALGASRGRMVGQVIIETLLLSLAGGLLALGIARWGGELVRTTLLPGVYFPSSALTGRLLLFTLLAALLAGVLAGIPPALQGRRTGVFGALGQGGRGSSQRRSPLRSSLTVTQAALSVMLLVGSGLFVMSLHELRGRDLGLEVEGLLMGTLEYTDPALDEEGQTALYEEALRQVSSLPGVASAAVTGVPFQWAFATDLEVPGLDSLPRLSGGGPYYYPVSPGYLETLGLAITQGRALDASDGGPGDRVAVVSETMARTLWPNEDALGRCIQVGGEEEPCTTVVGVAEDAARGFLEDSPYMAYYVPSSQLDTPHRAIYVRVAARSGELRLELARLLRSFSADVRYAHVRSIEEMLDPQARAWKLGATMFTVFGLLALALAAVGLYGVLAFDVAQRTRELGIRSALGAHTGRLLRSVLYHGGRLGVLGVALGLGSAYVAAPFVRELLFEVSPRDPRVFVAVALVLMGVTAAASLLPGVRATRVDPIEALRTD